MKLSVIGAGYVGLTTAACLAHIGHDVFCSESELAKLTKLQNGEMPIFEPHLESVIKSVREAARLGLQGEGSAMIVLTRRDGKPWGMICAPVVAGEG